MLENISVILALAGLLFSLINFLILARRERYSHNAKVNLEINRNALKLVGHELKDEASANHLLKEIAMLINDIYPQSNARIFVKLISEIDFDNPGKSQVITWLSFPDTKTVLSSKYTINQNTELEYVFINGNQYFFVSDINDSKSLGSYITQDKDSSKWLNTVIVYPICKKQDSGSNHIIGFLSVASPKKFNNVKKNEQILEIVRLAANKLYDFIQRKQKDTESTLSENQ